MLHDRGYTFHGDAPIAGLTRSEIKQLTLGAIVRQEQEERAREKEQQTSRRQYSEPRRTTDEALADYNEKLRDQGYQ